jgi:phage gp29-like protein
MKFNLFKKAPAPAPAEKRQFAAAPRGMTNDIAQTVTYRGLNNVMFDPDETLKKAGLSRADLKRLTKDPEIWQCICKRVNALVATSWRLEPNASRNNKWLAAQLTPHIETLLTATVNAVLFGYAVVEVTYQDGDRVSIAKLSEKPFSWFTPTHEGLLYTDRQTGQIITCDPRKFILITSRASYENPYGEALVSRLWWDVYHKFQLWSNWALFIERFAAPLLVGKTGGNVTEFTQNLTMAVRGAAISVGTQDDVKAVEVASSGDAFIKMNDAINAAIQKLILGQTLTSQVGSSGSYAAAQVHADVQTEQRNADIRLASCAVQSLVNTLASFNGFDAPQFVMADDTGLELERAQRDALLVERGVLTLTENYLLDRYDYQAGDFTVPAAAPAMPQPAAGLRANLAAGDPFTPEQMVIERIADDALTALGNPIQKQAIASAIKAAKDPDDLAERLAVVLRDADLNEYNRTLERALFAADILGFAHAS